MSLDKLNKLPLRIGAGIVLLNSNNQVFVGKRIDNPKNLLGKKWKGKYRGQKQKWFIMRFIGSEDEINIKTKKAEFKEWKWIDINQLISVAVSFKIKVYEKIVNELKVLLD